MGKIEKTVGTRVDCITWQSAPIKLSQKIGNRDRGQDQDIAWLRVNWQSLLLRTFLLGSQGIFDFFCPSEMSLNLA